MARVEAKWEYPNYSAYSVFNVINPLICWQEPLNHPVVKEFRVQLYKIEDDRYVDLGITSDTYMPLPTDDYTIRSSYKIRIATIGADNRQSSFAEGAAVVASPLRFDFSSSNVARLPDGRGLKSQRLLFLLI